MIINDPVLLRFRDELNKVYGNRLDRVILYGSRARGEARPDSDYDVAVFLKNYKDFYTETEVLSDIELDILEDTGAIINSLPFKPEEYSQRTGFMQNVREDGREL